MVTGATPRGRALRRVRAAAPHRASATCPATFVDVERPSAPLRWVNEWNNLDGSIERGYAGPVDLLRRRPRRAGSLARAGDYARLLASVGHQRLHHQQRQRRHAPADRRVPPGARARRRGVPAVGREALDLGGLQQPAEARRPRHVRSARPGRRGVLEGARRRDLPRDPRLRRLHAQGGLGGPARALGLRAHARRRGQRDRAGARAARRRHLLSRLRLRPPHGLAQPEERSRPRRLRQLQGARRTVRRERRPADQARPDRLPGARARLAAVRARCRRPTR